MTDPLKFSTAAVAAADPVYFMWDFSPQKISCSWARGEDETQLASKLLPAGYPDYVIVSYPGTDYEKVVPTEYAKSSIHGLVLDLTLLNKVEVERLEKVLCIVFDKLMFRGENKLLEWENLFEALKKNEFEFACGHPCFWSLENRSMFIDYVYSLFTSDDENVRAHVYKAMSTIDVFDGWREVLDDPYKAPLKSVFDKCGSMLVTPSDASREEKRWAEGGEMILFVKNCYDHLTSVEIGPLNQRCYTHIDFMSDDPLYKDIEFFNHMATHFLYPKLWIELYTALYNDGYKFKIGGDL